MSAKLSGKAKAIAMLTRTEGLKQNSSQGQSVDSETVKQNIIYPRVRTISIRDEKVRRYSIEKWRSRIKNLVKQMAKLDADLTALGTGFSQTECGAGTALTLDHIFGGLRQLRAANAPAPYNLLMSDKGIWGSKGLQGLLVDVAVTGSNSKPGSLLGEQGQEMLSRGFVTSIGGIDVYFSNEIEDDVGSGGDSASFMFSKGAMGLAVGPEGLFRIETERNASFRSTEYVATGFWGEVESKDAFGMEMPSA